MKMKKLQDKTKCQYSWDGSNCFNIIEAPSTYEDAVYQHDINITYQEEYNCTKLNEQLIPNASICTREVNNGTSIEWDFKEGCDWSGEQGYFCKQEVLV